MQLLFSQPARPSLRPFVRAYAQRQVTADAPVVGVPPRLEQILQFDFGPPTEVWRGAKEYFQSPRSVVAGAFAEAGTRLRLRAGIETFAAFFRPAGFSQLFGLPMREVTATYIDAEALLGATFRDLRQQMADARSFEARVGLLEDFLIRRLHVDRTTAIERTANAILTVRGSVTIGRAAAAAGMRMRQFERRFANEVGLTPKRFARVARFQAALDTKLARPQMTWRDIAHEIGYHDQMHMVHDFTHIGGATPSRLILAIGDARPPASIHD